MKITINATHIATLESKRAWINRVPAILPKLPMAEKLLFVDKNGNVTTQGEDFSVAEETDAYPVNIYHLTRTTNAEPETTHPAPRTP